MASVVDICNLALAHLGDSATLSSIDPPEGSAQAEHCARFYPIARDLLLEMHSWGFATKRTVLALTAEESFCWTYAYEAPANFIKILSILPYEAASDAETQPYEVESGASGNIILSNQETATARYIERVTDTLRFPPLVVAALAWLLASYLAGPVLKGDVGAAEGKRCLAIFNMLIGQAKLSDANQRKRDIEQHTAWIEGR